MNLPAAVTVFRCDSYDRRIWQSRLGYHCSVSWIRKRRSIVICISNGYRYSRRRTELRVCVHLFGNHLIRLSNIYWIYYTATFNIYKGTVYIQWTILNLFNFLIKIYFTSETYTFIIHIFNKYENIKCNYETVINILLK